MGANNPLKIGIFFTVGLSESTLLRNLGTLKADRFSKEIR